MWNRYGSAVQRTLSAVPSSGGGSEGNISLSRTSTRNTAAVLRSIFDHFDHDKNGEIDQKEMTELVKTIYELELACSKDPWYQADRYMIESSTIVHHNCISNGFCTLKYVIVRSSDRDDRRLSAETKWTVEARLIFQRADTSGSGAVDFDEFSHAVHGMPVLALGLALFRQVAHLRFETPDGPTMAASDAKAAVDSAKVQALTQAVERAVVGSSRVMLRLTGVQRPKGSSPHESASPHRSSLSSLGSSIGNLLHHTHTEYVFF